MAPVTRRAFLATAAALPAVAAPAAPARAASRPAAVKFKPGLVTYNVAKDWDLPTILAACRKADIAAVELRTTHKHRVEPSMWPASRADVRRRFADAGVVFWGCGTTCEFHSPDPAVVAKNVEECKRFLRLVKDLGGKGVKVRPNGVPKGETPEEACDRIGAALKLCGRAAADLGLEVWVEVHGAVTQFPVNMKRIMDACGHPAVGVTWNSNKTDLVDGSLAEGFKLLAPHIKSCHVNDFGSGYPYRDLFARLAGIGYDRYTLCEVAAPVKAADGAAWLTRYRAEWAEAAGV